MRWLLALSCVVYRASVMLGEEPPKSLDPRLKIELFAENPQIVTPTGIDVEIVFLEGVFISG